MLIEPVTVQDIIAAIKFYWRRYKKIPRYIKLIKQSNAIYAVDNEKVIDVKKTMQQIKERRKLLANGFRLVADHYMSNKPYVKKYTKHR